MFFKLPFVVPLRLLTSLFHIILSALMLMYRDWNVLTCGEEVLDNALIRQAKDTESTILLSLMIGLGGLEILSLLCGLTFYSQLQNFSSSILHSTGCIALLYVLLNQQCINNTWVIFGVCSALPFVTEIVTIFNICCFKGLPAW